MLVYVSQTILVDYIHDELHRNQLETIANQIVKEVDSSGKNSPNNIIEKYGSGSYSIYIEDSEGKSFANKQIKPYLDIIKESRQSGLFHISENNRSTLGYSSTFEIEGRKTTVAVVEKNSFSAKILNKLHALIWYLSITLFIAASTIVYFGVAIALKPLRVMSVQLNALKKGDRKRLDEKVPEEFRELVKHLNRLLESYEKKLNRSRHLAADVSHSLKTPLAVMHSILDNNAIPSTIVTELRYQLSDMHELIDIQMRKTEMAGQHIGKATPIVEKALALIDAVSRIYSSKKIYLEEALPRELVWPIDERDFNEIIGNLLDNASKWSYQEAYLYLNVQEETLTILVEDDGPGVADHQLTELTKRQKRLDEKTPGYGLGLSIVEEIVTDYTGIIHFSTSPKGGLRVMVELPKII